MVKALQRVAATRVPGKPATGSIQTQDFYIRNLYLRVVALTGESTNECKILVLATYSLDLAKRLRNRIIILNQGKIESIQQNLI